MKTKKDGDTLIRKALAFENDLDARIAETKRAVLTQKKALREATRSMAQTQAVDYDEDDDKLFNHKHLSTLFVNKKQNTVKQRKKQTHNCLM